MNESPDTWELLDSAEIADCRVFKVTRGRWRRSSDQAEADFFTIDNPNWVNILALTAEKEVVLIRQFRFGTAETIVELPGGMVDDGEEPETAAKRELLEETGFSSENWRLIGVSEPNPALQGNSLYHFLAEDCILTAEPAQDEHESVAAVKMPLSDARELIASGRMRHSLVVAAFYYLDHYERYESRTS